MTNVFVALLYLKTENQGQIISFLSRGVNRGWAGVLLSTLGFYKIRVLGWAKKLRMGKFPIYLSFARFYFCIPYLKSW